MTQKLEIPATNHGDRALDQADNCVAQRGRLPRVRSDARTAEYGVGDFTIAGAVLAAVRSLQHEPNASPLLFCDARVLDGGPTVPGSPEACGRLDVSQRIVTHRDECGERGLRRAARKKEEFNPAGAVECVDAFRAMALISKAGGRRMRQRRVQNVRMRERENRGTGTRRPEDVLG